jgi:hypothetical protein
MNFINENTISPSAAVTSFTTALKALQIHLHCWHPISAPYRVKKQFCLLNYQVHRRQQYGALILSDSGF